MTNLTFSRRHLTLFSLVILALPGRIPAAAADSRVADAAAKQDVVAVRSLIQAHADVNAPQHDGSTAILWAAYYSDLDMARALVAAGAKVDIPNRDGVSPLLQACRLGNFPMVDLLLKAGASAKTASPDGETALMAAAGAGSLESVNLLLARGADAKAYESVGNQTALMWASMGGYVPILQALLKAGADPNAVAEVSPLSTNSSGDAAGRSWVGHATGGFTALMFAARQGQIEAARTLLDAGAKPNYANPDGLTALMIAIINDRRDLAAMLAEKGANANDGSLYEAVQLHNSRVLEQNQSATRAKLWHENTTSPIDLIGVLLDHGAEPGRIATHAINIPGVNGGVKGVAQPVNTSAYARALQLQDVAALKLMLAKGASPNASDGGALPLAAVVGGGGAGRAGVFGARASPLRFESERSAEGAVKALLDAGAGVNAADRTGNTPLHAAAQSGNTEMIQLFADRGATLDVKNAAGFTPLDLAMGKGAPPGGRGGPGGGGGFGRGGGPRPQPEAIALLRKLMGLPALSPEEMPKAAAAPGRGAM